MRIGKRAIGAAAAALAIANAAAAHPGHGLAGGSSHWLHYLGEPLHVAPLALAGLALALVWQRRRRAARARTR
jgi:MYXO-CTERM domain-containing protein